METAFRRIEVGGQEPGQPRARHRRLRRLLPVPRRHGRDGAPPDRHRARRPTSATRPCPTQVRTRTLAEETKRVFRSRVVNPKWIAAMQRHGYKGAFEMAPPSTTCSATTRPPASSTTGCTSSWPRPTSSTQTNARIHDASRTRGPCAASPSGCSRRPTAVCGPHPRTRHWTGCARCTSSSRATSRAARDRDGRRAMSGAFPFSGGRRHGRHAARARPQRGVARRSAACSCAARRAAPSRPPSAR